MYTSTEVLILINAWKSLHLQNNLRYLFDGRKELGLELRKLEIKVISGYVERKLDFS